MNGGLLVGNIIDICGIAASGKTQLYTTIAINLVAAQNCDVFLIDTKGDFSSERINRMLLSRRILNQNQRNYIMSSIKVEKCNDPLVLIELIEKLTEQAKSYPRLKMLVIDSLASLWFLYHGNHLLAQQKMGILTNLLRKLAVEHSIVVLTVNILTRKNSNGERKKTRFFGFFFGFFICKCMKIL